MMLRKFPTRIVFIFTNKKFYYKILVNYIAIGIYFAIPDVCCGCQFVPGKSFFFLNYPIFSNFWKSSLKHPVEYAHIQLSILEMMLNNMKCKTLEINRYSFPNSVHQQAQRKQWFKMKVIEERTNELFTIWWNIRSEGMMFPGRHIQALMDRENGEN